MASNDSSAAGLKVGIVGAGVAGLAAAIALRRIGHDVEVRDNRRAQRSLTKVVIGCNIQC